MPMLSVRAKPGRVAYTAPRGGKLIPSDKFVPAPDTSYVRRLIEVHGDIELQAESPKPTAAASPAQVTVPAAPEEASS